MHSDAIVNAGTSIRYYCDKGAATAYQHAISCLNRVGLKKRAGRSENHMVKIWKVYGSDGPMGRREAADIDAYLDPFVNAVKTWDSVEELAASRHVHAVIEIAGHNEQCTTLQPGNTAFSSSRMYPAEVMLFKLLVHDKADATAVSSIQNLKMQLRSIGVPEDNLTETKMKLCMRDLKKHLETDGDVPLGRQASSVLKHMGSEYVEDWATKMANTGDSKLNLDISDGFVHCIFIPSHAYQLMENVLKSTAFAPEISFDYRRQLKGDFIGCYTASVTLPGNSEHCFAVMAVDRNECEEDTREFFEFLKSTFPGLDDESCTMYFDNNFASLAIEVFPQATKIPDWMHLMKNMKGRHPKQDLELLRVAMWTCDDNHHLSTANKISATTLQYLENRAINPLNAARVNRTYPTMYGRMCTHAEALNSQHEGKLRKLPLVSFLDQFNLDSHAYLCKHYEEALKAPTPESPIGMFYSKLTSSVATQSRLRTPRSLSRIGAVETFSVDFPPAEGPEANGKHEVMVRWTHDNPEWNSAEYGTTVSFGNIRCILFSATVIRVILALCAFAGTFRGGTSATAVWDASMDCGTQVYPVPMYSKLPHTLEPLFPCLLGGRNKQWSLYSMSRDHN
eukprot:m.90002 g.90002  ORF g.90002 m.90002 type:complete len:621 (-) comp16452_c0_seq5:1147-3009(-)